MLGIIYAKAGSVGQQKPLPAQT